MKRLMSIVALGACTIGLAAGCAKAPETAGTTEVQSNAGVSTPKVSVPDTAAHSGTTKASGDSTDTTARRSGSTTTTAASSIPGVPSIPGGPSIPSVPSIPNVPGAGDLQKCIDLATAYSGLFLPLSSGSASDADIAKATQSLEDLKGKVPQNIQADLDVIEQGIKNAGGLVGLSQFMASDAFSKANDEITSYLSTTCTQGGGN